MPILDATNLTQTYLHSVAGAADFAAYVNHDATFYSWITSDGHLVTVFGTGIAVDGSNVPTAGTITSVTIDVGNDSPLLPDIDITGLSFDLTTLVFSVGTAANNVFWATVLSGQTEVIYGSGAQVSLGGDFADLVLPGTFLAENDSFVGQDANVFGSGDAVTVSDATLIAGDDNVGGVFSVFRGDAFEAINSARIVGGDDTIVYTVDFTAQAGFTISGDVRDIRNTATGFCGASQFPFAVIHPGSNRVNPNRPFAAPKIDRRVADKTDL